MSVINSMLKDLEHRGVERSSSDYILSGLSANNSADSQEKNSYLLWLVGGISILAVIVLMYYFSPYKLVSTAAENSEIQRAGEDNSKSVMQAVSTKPVVVTQNEILANTVVNTQSVSEQKNINLDGVASHKIETKQPDSPVLTVPAIVDIEQKKAVFKQDEQGPGRSLDVSVQETTIAAVPIRHVQTKSMQQKVVLEKAEDVDLYDQSTDDLQVVSKKQRELTNQEKSQQNYATARSLYAEGSKQRSKALLQQALSYDAHNKEACRLLSAIYLEDGRADLASEILEQGLLVHVNDQGLLRLYLQSLVQSDKYKDAIAVMERRLQLVTPEDLGYLAGLYQKNNDHLNAVSLYSKALQLKPSNSIWWLGQGVSFEIMKKYSEALRSYQQSITTGQLSGKLAQYAINKIKSIQQLHADSTS